MHETAHRSWYFAVCEGLETVPSYAVHALENTLVCTLCLK
jgi:hypothetical protein